MKNSIYLLLILLSSCEIADNYSESYQLKYRRPIAMLMSPALDSLALSGNGVKIGVIDAGFGYFKSNEFTKNLKVADYKDFIDNDTTRFFSDNENDHGTMVTSSIGGKKNELVHGLAYNATYFLAKTEDAATELKIEEERLISAIDWMVANEVDIINISIAYTTFEDANYYTQANLDGKTAKSSKYIAQILEDNPDLIIPVSAGNEGNKEWRNIMFPSDVKEVITVGSTDFDGEIRWKSSGIGVDDVGYIKPDVATYPIPLGNSHTAPVIAGLCALIKELHPSLHREELIDALHKTSTNAQKPNTEIGYGVPQSEALLKTLQ